MHWLLQHDRLSFKHTPMFRHTDAFRYVGAPIVLLRACLENTEEAVRARILFAVDSYCSHTVYSAEVTNSAYFETIRQKRKG